VEASAKLLGYEAIQLVSPYELTELHDLTITKKVNEHAAIYITGIIPEEKRDSYIRDSSARDRIEVRLLLPTGPQTIFTGLVTKLQVRAINQVYTIEIHGLSDTYLLDIVKKTRSFQNTNLTYWQLFQKILQDYPGGDCIDYATDRAKIGRWVMQYRETDWELMKRVASRIGAVLVPEATREGPKFYMGLPDDDGVLEDFTYRIKKNLSDYSDTAANYDPKVAEWEFISYLVESDRYLKIGDKVNFQNKTLAVAGSTASLSQGALKFEYLLAHPLGIRQNPISNKGLTGTALMGKVIDRRLDQVRVHLAVDRDQPKDEAVWFPYSTMYTAEGNSGWYFPPELGDTVLLYFPNHQETEALVLCSVRQDGQRNPKAANPGIKYLGTAHGKELKLGATDLVLTAKSTEEGKKIFIQLDEEQGIEVRSDKPLEFHAKKDFIINAKKSFKVKAKRGIYLACKSSSIVLDGKTDIAGAQITIRATAKTKAQSQPEPVQEQKEGLGGYLLRQLQNIFDLSSASSIPGTEGAAVLNAGIYALRGDWKNAKIAMAAAIPFGFGDKAIIDKIQANREEYLDSAQLALEAIGLVPGVGDAADLINAGIYAARGRFADAGLSLAAAAPIVGTGTRIGKWISKVPVNPVQARQLGLTIKSIIISMGLKNADAARAAFERGDYDTGFRCLFGTVGALRSVGKVQTSARGVQTALADSADDAFAGVKKAGKKRTRLTTKSLEIEQKGKIPPNLTPEGAGRRGAFREAKRRSGIPTSQQPRKVTPAVDKRGNRIQGRDYDFGDGKVIRDHSGGHRYPDDPTQNRGPHFNDIYGNHYDY